MTQVSDDRIAVARRMRAEGKLLREISDALDVPRGTVSGWIDPAAAQKQKARRERYRGKCESCGAHTSGCNGRALAPKLCARCSQAKRHADRFWTKDTILAAFQRYHAEYGDQPSASEILVMRPGPWFPSVHAVQREFGSWSAAIRAAGWRPNAKVPTKEALDMHGYMILRQNGDGGFHPVAQVDAPKREDALRKHIAALPETEREGVYATVPVSQWAPRHVRLRMQPVLVFDPPASPIQETA